MDPIVNPVTNLLVPPVDIILIPGRSSSMYVAELLPVEYQEFNTLSRLVDLAYLPAALPRSPSTGPSPQIALDCPEARGNSGVSALRRQRCQDYAAEKQQFPRRPPRLQTKQRALTASLQRLSRPNVQQYKVGRKVSASRNRLDEERRIKPHVGASPSPPGPFAYNRYRHPGPLPTHQAHPGNPTAVRPRPIRAGRDKASIAAAVVRCTVAPPTSRPISASYAAR